VSRRAVATINTAALTHNFSVVRQCAPKARVMAMVKSNAYGHGLQEVVETLKDADAFGLAHLDEAVQLRDAGCEAELTLMSGFYDVSELKAASAHNLQVVVHEPTQLKLLENNPLPVKVWMKVDTGMHRLGFAHDEVARIYQSLKALPHVQLQGVMTHLACADDVNDAHTKEQLSVYANCMQQLPDIPVKSVANSAGILAWPESHADWVRPGIMLYGCSPMMGLTGVEHKLKPAMTLSARIIAISDCDSGDAIGYGATYTCDAPTRVAIVSVGYGDGYPRHAATGTPVSIRGTLCPLLGRVSMDMIAVDLSNMEEAAVGDKVVLWGEGCPAEMVAEHANTIAYELFCNMTQRVRVEYA